MPTQIFKPELSECTLEELRKKGKQIKIEYTPDDIKFVESMTKNVDWYWQRFRVGRVTATMFKKVCRTSITNVAMTYIKQICWPEKTTFTSVATDFGKQNEPIALAKFCNEMKVSHQNFNCGKSGIILNNDYPFFSATPDGIIECDCCGVSSVEIKCPYNLSKKPTTLIEFCKIKHSFLTYENNRFELDKNHEYFYQVQMQMAMLQNNYCYFYVWGKDDTCLIKIDKDDIFWFQNSQKATIYVENVLLPEIMANYYSNKNE